MPAEVIRETVQIAGTRGALAGELTYPFGGTAFSVLLVNPHPHMGGHTGNRLMLRVAEVLAEAGGVALSFDYSGVGESEGPRVDVAESMLQFWQTGAAPEDRRMVDDAGHALSWICQEASRPLILLGYSFGAYAATVAMNREVDGLILISPTVKQHDFSTLKRRSIPKLVIHSDNDFATPREDFVAWLRELPQPVQTYCVPGGDHFFRGREADVADACHAFARRIVETAAV